MTNEERHDHLLHEAAQHLAPVAGKLRVLLGHDAGVLLLAASAKVLEQTDDRAQIRALLLRLAQEYTEDEDGVVLN